MTLIIDMCNIHRAQHEREMGARLPGVPRTARCSNSSSYRNTGYARTRSITHARALEKKKAMRAVVEVLGVRCEM